MSYCKTNGKDKFVFVTEEDADKPPVVASLIDEADYGVILPDGSINWDCPCLGGLPDGPCGDTFKASFSCFHYSEQEPKGSECIEQFVAMQECFKNHPELYSKYDTDDTDDGANDSDDSVRQSDDN